MDLINKFHYHVLLFLVLNPAEKAHF